MSLRSKIVLILSGVVLAYAAFDNVSMRFMVGKSFTDLEHEEARKDLGRVVAGLEMHQQELLVLCRTFAGMDATLDFVRHPDAEYVDAHFGGGSPAGVGVDLFYLCDRDGRVLWGDVLDPVTERSTSLRQFPRESLADSHPARRWPGTKSDHGGLFATELGVMLVGASQIRGADGTVEGTVIAGRFVEEGRIEDEVAKQTGVAFDLIGEEFDDATGGRGVRDLVDPDGAPLIQTHEAGLAIHRKLPDLSGNPSILLTVERPTDITTRGLRVSRYAMFSALAAALLLLLVLVVLLQRIVIHPLTRLTAHAVEIGRTDDTTARLDLVRPDELGQLAEQFDRMIEKLATSRAQVVDTARWAGMSEIATGVLHNVGNVLNSVNVSASLVRRRAEKLPLGDLEKLVEILEEHASDLAGFVGHDPRGKHLLPFLQQLCSALRKQRDDMRRELLSLSSGIDHVADLVRAQQSYAGTKGVFEITSLPEQIDAAIAICRQALGTSDDVELVRDFGEVRSARIDRHKFMEIVINLIQNARQAVLESDSSTKRVVVRLYETRDVVRLEVEDNGVGIPTADLKRIFNHGFTTRPDGHGFGLHVSANAAKEMGAMLRGESDGPGCGARFTLEIPLQEREAALAA